MEEQKSNWLFNIRLFQVPWKWPTEKRECFFLLKVGELTIWLWFGLVASQHEWLHLCHSINSVKALWGSPDLNQSMLSPSLNTRTQPGTRAGQDSRSCHLQWRACWSPLLYSSPREEFSPKLLHLTEEGFFWIKVATAAIAIKFRNKRKAVSFLPKLHQSPEMREASKRS